MARKQDLVDKWAIIEYDDGYIDKPIQLQKAIQEGLIEMTPYTPDNFDLRAFFKDTGWACGNILAKAGKIFTCNQSYFSKKIRENVFAVYNFEFTRKIVEKLSKKNRA